MERRMKQRRLKLQTRKPSIKITVSADIPDSINSSPNTPPLPNQFSVRKIVSFEDGSEPVESNTRIMVDDSAIDFFPNCIDFGIKDFLCCKDEIDLELSSDTDTSFLEATPPHRFSDSEFDGQIDIMSITLDTALNMGPNSTSLANSPTISKDDAFTIDLSNDDNNLDENTKEISNGYELSGYPEIEKRKAIESENKPKRLPPPRPFKRHISLPASIFMSYLLAEQNRALKVKGSMANVMDSTESAWNDYGSVNRKNDRFATRKLAKIAGSYSSTESTEDKAPGDSSNASESSGYLNCYSDSERKGNFSADAGDSENEDQGKQAFTSEIERKSLVLRYMRRLVRQDTTGNFAPPDYCI